MKRARLGLPLVLLSLALSLSASLGAEKLKLGAGIKANPFYDLPAQVALEKGFWSRQGLEVEYVPLRGAADLARAAAAGSVCCGMTSGTSIVQVASGGVPLVIVADLGYQDFFILVRKEAAIKEPGDLRGQRIGIPGLGGIVHAYGRLVVKQLGIEKEVRFVAAGGLTEQVASLKAGRMDVTILSTAAIPLIHAGVVRKLLATRPFLPKDWLSQAMFATRDSIESNPRALGSLTKGLVEATRFILDNEAWSVEKLQAMQGTKPEVARDVYRILEFSRDGKVARQAVENVVAFMVEHGLLKKERAPAVDALFTMRFTP